MLIEVLGPGCPKCEKLAENAKKALKEAGVAGELVKVKDIKAIMERGVMFTPALSVDGVIKCAGKVASADDIKSWLTAPKK